ncbi:MAG: hypothetical protein ABI863_12585 [Ginsengibacter sp.]
MKKTTHISKTFIAIAAVTIFISCKKEIERPEKPAIQVVNPVAVTKTKIPPINYDPWPDSTKAHP